MRIKVVGTLNGLKHEQDLVAADEHFKSEEMRLDLASGERLQRPKEVARHLQSIRGLEKGNKFLHVSFGRGMSLHHVVHWSVLGQS